MKIKIGCCGWGFYRGGMKAYLKNFEIVEVQTSFYKLPMVKTAERWRADAPKGFEYTLKAWQAITHPTSGPTWRRAGLKLSEAQKTNYGMLQPTRENFEAWRMTKEICDALKAKICVIQCPAKFTCTPKNIANMQKFLGKIDRGNLALIWEPRGDWKDHPEKIAKLCEELNLVHCVDLMRRKPVSGHEISYIRLHGLNPREYDYNYRYSPAELKQLAAKVRVLAKKHREVYVMFNNFFMYDSATRLMKILKSNI